ncbi:MAG TPA: hypothetical protein PK887_10390 [Ignavibacteriales bacterium]|nr:hypothetical protein [Ignavibacteriales bacterium]
MEKIKMVSGKAPGIKEFPADSLEKKVYTLVEKYVNYIPYDADRYRLAFNLINYLNDKGDAPEILVKTTRVTFKGITPEEFAKILNEDLKSLEN